MRRVLASLALPLMLAACGGGDDGGGATPSTPSVPPPAVTSYNVQSCLDQVVVPGRTLANMVVPDTIELDLSKPSSFPNGRQLTDSVIDLTLAALFIDVNKHGVDVLAKIPLGPQANDVPFRQNFPYLAPPQGLTPTAGGANFNFRTDSVTSTQYVQVDRMGMPAVATAVIGSSAKSPYNDDSPAVDGTRKYVNEISTTLTGLTNALADDFTKLGLNLCAKPA
jgi:hypothetical protein